MELFHLFIDHQKSWNLAFMSRGHCGPSHSITTLLLPCIFYIHWRWRDIIKKTANQDSSERVVDQMIPKLSLSGTAAGTNAIPIGLTPPQDLNCIWGRLEPRRRPHEVWDTTAMHLCPCKRARPIVATGLSKLSTVIVIFFTTNKTIQGSSIPICPGRPYHVDMGNFKYAF